MKKTLVSSNFEVTVNKEYFSFTFIPSIGISWQQSFYGHLYFFMFVWLIFSYTVLIETPKTPQP